MKEFEVAPAPDDRRLTRVVEGIDHAGLSIEARVVEERPLTLYLNAQEIVTMMTIGDHPDYLAVGYLLNQNMLTSAQAVEAVDYDEDLGVVVVRTAEPTDFEDKLKKRTLTSGCAQGTAFGDVMETFEQVELARDAVLKTSWLYALSRKINPVSYTHLTLPTILRV